MKPIIINVSLNDKINIFSYPIFIGNGLLSNCEEILKKFVLKRKVILIHDNFFSLKNKDNEQFISFVETIKKLTESVNLIGIPGGDKSKNISQLDYILEESLSFKIDRSSLIIAFGGGVIGDLAGFAASILLRGIDFVQIPTTLLAQVDSSVGGKTGINSSKSKNLIGSFHQPIAVIADIDMLKTLPKREFLAGLVEVIKYGLIYDVEFFNSLEDNYKDILNYDKFKLNEVISKSCEIKTLIIKNDEKENGKRALLNLGHTFGHAIESFGKYDGTIIHGEAVSIGICLAFRLSSKMGYCPQVETDRVVRFFKKLTLPTSLQELINLPITTSEMLKKFKYDKKNKNNQLTFILNEKIGKSFIKNNMDENILIEFLNDEI
jgi:3-dehydroquinate synthase